MKSHIEFCCNLNSTVRHESTLCTLDSDKKSVIMNKKLGYYI